MNNLPAAERKGSRPRDHDLPIRAEYTGAGPDLKPAAGAFARIIRGIVKDDGTFADPTLEAEYREWAAQRKETAS